MALTGLRIRLPLATKRSVLSTDLVGGLRPARFLLAALIASFVLALLYVLQIETLVQMDAQIASLEDDLASELIKQEALRVELAKLHDLSAIERTAFLDLEMIEIDKPNVVPIPELPEGIDLSNPAWSDPPRVTKLDWWHKVLIQLNEIIQGRNDGSNHGRPRG